MKRLAPLIAVAAISAAAPAVAGDLDFTFETASPTGRILVALYDSRSAYEGGGAPVRQAAVEVSGPSASAAFDGLAEGDYAMRAFHDVNGDGRMDVNPFGLPVEPYAFSNNARGAMGPARWDQARVAVAGGPVVQTISLK